MNKRMFNIRLWVWWFELQFVYAIILHQEKLRPLKFLKKIATNTRMFRSKRENVFYLTIRPI